MQNNIPPGAVLTGGKSKKSIKAKTKAKKAKAKANGKANGKANIRRSKTRRH